MRATNTRHGRRLNCRFGGARRFSAQPHPGFNFTTSLPLAITASARRDTPSQSEPGRTRPPPGRRGQAKPGPPPGNGISSSWRFGNPGLCKDACEELLHRHRTPGDQLPDRAAWYRALASDPTLLPTYSPVGMTLSANRNHGVESASREKTG